MKLFQLLTLSFCLFFFAQCKNAEEDSRSIVELCKNDPIIDFSINTGKELILKFPACFELNVLQGIDTYIGYLNSTSEGIEIFYDIGVLAGESVSENSPNQVEVQGNFEIFRYHIQDNALTFTFPNAGPANFRTEQIEHQDDLIELFKSLQIN